MSLPEVDWTPIQNAISHLDQDTLEILNKEIQIVQGTLSAIKSKFNQVSKAQAEALVNSATILEELEQSQTKAEQASLAKSEFIANISHEIRTPMNGIICTTRLLQQTELDSKQQKYSKIISSSSNVLLDLVNNILDYSKIESGNLETDIDPFDLQILLEDIVEGFAASANEKALPLTLAYSLDTPTNVLGDGFRVRQILTNFISNAIKFSEKGEVAVTVNSAPAGKDQVVFKIQVRDSGCGIPKDKIQKLFTPFTQVDSSISKRYGGTGLGLAICKKLAILLEAEVGVDSEEGVGSTFWLEIPLKLSPYEENKSQCELKDKKYKVVLVDDAEIECKHVKNCCEQWGFSVDQLDPLDDSLISFLEKQDAKSSYNIFLISSSIINKLESKAINRFCDWVKETPSKIVLISGLEDDSWLNQISCLGKTFVIRRPLRKQELRDELYLAINDAKPPVQIQSQQRSFEKTNSIVQLKPEENLSQRKILLAEDQEMNQIVTKEILSTAGFEVMLANDGREALNAFKKHKYELVLMDCQMPEVDGYQATENIRQFELQNEIASAKRTPIVALTANVSDEDQKRCIDSGMDAVIGKPFEPEGLLEAISKYVGGIETSLKVKSDTKDLSNSNQNSDPQPIDLGGLFDICCGKAEQVCQVLQMFQKKAALWIPDFKKAIEARDMEQAHYLSHAIKGTAGIISATTLYESAAKLDQLAKEGDISGVELSYGSFLEELNQCLDFVEHLLILEDFGVNSF